MTEANQTQQTEAAVEAKQEPQHVINAKHNPNVDVKDVTYTFRKQKDEATGLEKKRPNIEMKLLVPSIEGLVEIFNNGGKPLELLQEVVAQTIIDQAREVLANDETLTADNFPYDSVTWDAIANQPDAERKGRGIPKEVWEEFGKSYLAVMPGITGKTEENIKRQLALIMAKFAPLKYHESRESILKNFAQMLTVYISTAKDAENFTQVIDFLNKKIQSMLEVKDEKNIEDALGFGD